MKRLSVTESLQHLRALIDSCDFDKAQASAEEVRTNEQHELRALGHMVGKIAYRQGNYSSALQHFLNAETAYGEYIGLTCDIASAHYMLENFEAFEQESLRAIRTLKKIRSSLSPETLIRTSLSLSKFCEELGLISEAVEICEAALASSNSLPSGMLESPRLLLRAQVLRLHAQFMSPPEKMRHHYRALLQLSKTKNRLFHNVDVQHSLMVAEMRLISTEQALVRLDYFIDSAGESAGDNAVSGSGVNEADVRLCYFDILAEGLLSTGRPLNPFRAIPFNHLTYFESSILSLQNEAGGTKTETHEKIPLAQRLLLLALTSQIASEENIRRIASQQLELLLSTLGDSDKALWRERLRSKKIACAEIFYDSIEGRLTSGTSTLLLQGKATRQIFEHLLLANRENRMLTTSDLSNAVWDETYTLAHYERVRVGTQRLNALLSKISGRRDNLTFSKLCVHLNPILKFKS